MIGMNHQQRRSSLSKSQHRRNPYEPTRMSDGGHDGPAVGHVAALGAGTFRTAAPGFIGSGPVRSPLCDVLQPQLFQQSLVPGEVPRRRGADGPTGSVVCDGAQTGNRPETTRSPSRARPAWREGRRTKKVKRPSHWVNRSIWSGEQRSCSLNNSPSRDRRSRLCPSIQQPSFQEIST